MICQETIYSSKIASWINLYRKQISQWTERLWSIKVVSGINRIIRIEQSRLTSNNWVTINKIIDQENNARTLDNGLMGHLHTCALRKSSLRSFK